VSKNAALDHTHSLCRIFDLMLMTLASADVGANGEFEWDRPIPSTNLLLKHYLVPSWL